jgi:hypothetical protein
MPVQKNKTTEKKKTRLTPEQRSMQLNRVLFSLLAVIMIVAMILALFAR